MKNIAIITARSGSKGVKDKNIRELCGKPLLAYSIECALSSRQFEKVFVSTESEKYAEIARFYGAEVPFLRSEENASDASSSWDTVREVINEWECRNEYFDSIMLLQPTSPLRTVEDINNSLSLMKEKDAKAIVSVCKAEHSPLWCNTLAEEGKMDNFYRKQYCNVNRQRLPEYYRLNGAIYLVRREELNNEEMFRHECYAYIMPNERSVDIDTELDFIIAKCLMENKENIR